MVSETFEIMNEKEKLLKGIIETEHPRKRQPVILFLNGFLDSMDSPGKRTLARKLREAGFVTVRFDHTYGFGTGTGDDAAFTFSHQVLDAERVIDHATRRGYVNPDKVIVVGHCFGGMGALLLSAFDERVKAVVTISAPYDFSDTRITRVDPRDMARIKLKRYFHLFSERFGREVRINYTFFEDGLAKDMARATRNIRQPLLVIHGRKDASIPVANAEEIYARANGPKELVLIDDLEHNPTERHIEELYGHIRPFLKKHLKV